MSCLYSDLSRNIKEHQNGIVWIHNTIDIWIADTLFHSIRKAQNLLSFIEWELC